MVGSWFQEALHREDLSYSPVADHAHLHSSSATPCPSLARILLLHAAPIKQLGSRLLNAGPIQQAAKPCNLPPRGEHKYSRDGTVAHPAVLYLQSSAHAPGLLRDGSRTCCALPLIAAQRSSYSGRRRRQPAGSRKRLRELQAVLRNGQRAQV